MTVYELIRELTYYSPDMEVFAEVDATKLRFDIGGLENEFRNAKPKDNRAVIVLDPY